MTPDSDLNPPLFRAIRFCIRWFVDLTMGRVYRLFGVPKEKTGLYHAEIYLIATTAVLIFLIVAVRFWPPLGWFVAVVGVIRLLQIVSLHFSAVVFDITPVNQSIAVEARARWHFVAISFSIFDAILIFGFLYEFLDRRYGILNQPLSGFFDYFFYATMAFFKSGLTTVYPVTFLGKLVVMSEAAIAFFFLVFLISGALGRLRR